MLGIGHFKKKKKKESQEMCTFEIRGSKWKIVVEREGEQSDNKKKSKRF